MSQKRAQYEHRRGDCCAADERECLNPTGTHKKPFNRRLKGFARRWFDGTFRCSDVARVDGQLADVQAGRITHLT
jgi:hypothetical protein